MVGVPENALEPLYFMSEMVETHKTYRAFADTQTHAFHMRKAAQTHVFREEMLGDLVRLRRTTCFHFRSRKALRTLQFLNEMVCRTHIFFTNRMGATTISIAKHRATMPWGHRASASTATLPTPLELSL